MLVVLCKTSSTVTLRLLVLNLMEPKLHKRLFRYYLPLMSVIGVVGGLSKQIIIVGELKSISTANMVAALFCISIGLLSLIVSFLGFGRR